MATPKAGTHQGTTIQVLPPGTYGPEDRDILQRSIPLGIIDFDLEVDTSQLTDPAVSVEIALDLSLDNGTTWNGNSVIGDCYAGAGVAGSASPAPKMSVGRGVPEPTNPDRLVRGRVRILGGSLVTSASLTTFTS